MANHSALTRIGIEPRLLKREQAAAYCGLSVHGFSEWVKTGRLPGPIRGTVRWDRKAIDAALDVLSRIEAKSEGEALDQWKAKHHKRHAERNSSS